LLQSQRLTPWISTPKRIEANSSRMKSNASQATMLISTTTASTAACTIVRLAAVLASFCGVDVDMMLPLVSTRGTTDRAAH